MAITSKPGVGRAECGCCGQTAHPCPSCPKLDGKPSRPDEHWQKIVGQDPEFGRLLKRNAIAARNVAIRDESDRDYAEWVIAYQQSGDDLAALYKRRPALLGPEAKWQ